MNKMEINYKTKVIGRRDDGVMIITNHPSLTLNDIYDKATIIDKQHNVLSCNDTIGKIIKFDNYVAVNEYLLDRNVILDSLLGFAIGDAFGVPVEFCDRDYVKSLNLNDMISGTHNVPKGSWSDDTSMIIATIDSIINNSGNINYKDIMNNFIKLVENGDFTSLGYAFDIGNTITKSLNKYKKTNDELNSGCGDLMDNGNGSLMRILPISLYCILNNLSNNETIDIISKASSLTHSHEISILGCYIYTMYLKEIVNSKNKLNAFEYILNLDYSYFKNDTLNVYSRLLSEEFLNIKEDEINSTGFIVDTLESVIYSINNSNSFKESIITSINLGNDTDTIAALTGAASGIIYNISSIPNKWLEDLSKKEYLIKYSNEYYKILTKVKTKRRNK